MPRHKIAKAYMKARTIMSDICSKIKNPKLEYETKCDILKVGLDEIYRILVAPEYYNKVNLFYYAPYCRSIFAEHLPGLEGESLLCSAVQAEEYQIAVHIIYLQGRGLGHDVHDDDYGWAPVHYAAKKDCGNFMHELLYRQGVPGCWSGVPESAINNTTELPSEEGVPAHSTPLHIAIRYGAVQNVEFLLQHANILKLLKDGNGYDQVELTRELIRIVRKINTGTEDEETTKHFGEKRLRDKRSIPAIADLERIQQLVAKMQIEKLAGVSDIRVASSALCERAKQGQVLVSSQKEKPVSDAKHDAPVRRMSTSMFA